MDELTLLALIARDSALAPGLQTSCGPAFRRFISLSHDEVRRFVARRVGTGRADDVTQATFEQAFRKLPGFHEEDARSWLLAIARREAGGGGPRRR